MKFEVKNHYTGNVQFTAELECDENARYSVKLGLSVKWGLKNGANLAGADLAGAVLDGAYLDGAYLDGAVLAGANLDGAVLDGAYLRGANLAGADLAGAYLRGANLDGAYLSGAVLSGAVLSGADLSGADLSGADLAGANLRDADLSGANLRDAVLSGAYLSGAVLSGAVLSGAVLSGADLSGADLSGAVLDKEKDIRLQRYNPVLMLTPIGSDRGTLIAYKTNKGVYLRRGCFFGTMEEFLAAVGKKHGDSQHGAVYRAACKFIDVWSGEEKREIAQAEKCLKSMIAERDCYYEGCANPGSGYVHDADDRAVLDSLDRDIDELRAVIAAAKGETK